MEKLQINQEEKIQKAISDSADEIYQLQNIVNALRSEIEKSQIDKEEDIQLAVIHANNQNKQLKETVNNLRNKLEKIQIGQQENPLSILLEEINTKIPTKANRIRKKNSGLIIFKSFK